jgi:hypothetical protein
MITKKLSIIIFFLSIVLFCVNLRLNFSEDMKIILFWTSIVIMLGMILYQIFYLKNNLFVLFEIILLFFLLHILYQINYFGLAESDSYRYYDFLKTIINSNFFVINLQSDVSGWPLLHLLTSSISTIIKVDPLIVAKFLPSFIESIIAISIYLFVHTIYKNEKAALLSCLIVGTIPKFISFESFFVRESFAIYFFILFIFVLYSAKQKDDSRFLALTLFLIPVMVLSHHFTSIMFMTILFILIVSSRIIPFLFRKDSTLHFNKINIIPIFVILLLCMIFYWLYFTPGIINDFYKIYLESIGIKEFSSYGQRIGIDTTIVTLRGNILFYGFFFFQGVLALILLITLFLKKQKQMIENVSFTFFLFFCLGLGAISLFLFGSLIYPDRFLPFGWLFGAIPLSILIFSLTNIKIRKIIVFIVISFLIFNIYNIDPEYYTGKGPFDGRASEKEYAIATTINISQPYFGYVGVGDTIYDIQQFDFAKGGMRNPLTSRNIFNYCNLSIVYKDLYITYLEAEEIKNYQSYKRIVALLSYEDFPNVNKISDVGDVFVLSWEPFIIYTSEGRGGFIDPSGVVGVISGMNQTFTIWASAGYKILDVFVDGASVGPVSTYTFDKVVKNHTIDVKTQYIITATASVGGHIDPIGVVNLNLGMNQTYQITMDIGYHIQDVLVDSVSIGAISTYTFYDVAKDHTIAVSFEIS